MVRVRVLHCAAGAIALMVVASEPAPKARAEGTLIATSPSVSVTAQTSPAEELARFVDLLDRFRRGDEEALVALRACGRTLCEVHARCDARDVAEYYAKLSPSERARGVEREQRFEELRAQVRDAGNVALRDEPWIALRTQVLDELGEVISASREAADVVPAARALALRARIEVEDLQNATSMTTEHRRALAELAENDAREAVDLFAQAGMVTPQLDPRWLLGRVQRFRGALRASLASFTEVEREARRLGQEEYRLHALRGQIDLARDRGDLLEGDRLLGELARVIDPQRDWPLARDWTARLLNSEHPEAALEFLARCAPAGAEPASDGRIASYRAEWELLSGIAAFRAGNLRAAREHMESLTHGPEAEQALLVRAMIELRERRERTVIELLPEGPARDRFSARDQAIVHTLLAEAWLALHEPAHAADEARSAIDSVDQLGERLLGEPLADGARAAAQNLLGEWSGVGLHGVAVLAAANAESGDALEAARVIEDYQSRSLRREDEELRRLRASAGQVVHRTPVTREALLSWASSTDLGLLTWVVGADFTVVVHVGPTNAAQASGAVAMTARAARIPYGRSAIEEAVRRLRETALSGDTTRTQVLADEIRAVLLPPVIAERLRPLARRDARLLLLLHGPLESLPVELLGLSGGRFDDQLVTLVLPGLPDDEPGTPPPSSSLNEWAVLGDPLSDPQSEGPRSALLPGAAEELSEVARLHPGAVVQAREHFDRAAMTAALRDRRALHVSTHLAASLPEEDRRFPNVGLTLSDGTVFSAREVADLAPKATLVVLSACATGSGRFVDAEGLQGLSRAFLESGTRNLVATLWPIEDRAAQRFAILFHRALAGGARPSFAVRDARVGLRAEGFAAADWAAFRLIGRD